MIAPRALLAALLILATITPADAFRWPWEPVRHVHRHHSRAKPAPLPPPNCTVILEAYNALDTYHRERALRDSTPKQRDAIDACLKGGSDDHRSE